MALGQQVAEWMTEPGLTTAEVRDRFARLTPVEVAAYYRQLDQDRRDYHLERFGALSCRRHFGTRQPPAQVSATPLARPRERRGTRRARPTRRSGDPDPEPDPGQLTARAAR